MVFDGRKLELGLDFGGFVDVVKRRLRVLRGIDFLLAVVHIFEFDFSDFFEEHTVGLFDFGIFLLKQSMFSGPFSEVIVIFGYFIRIELFFGLVNGYIILFSNGEKLGWLLGTKGEGVVDADIEKGVSFHELSNKYIIA